jgi:hypothetical protein
MRSWNLGWALATVLLIPVIGPGCGSTGKSESDGGVDPTIDAALDTPDSGSSTDAGPSIDGAPPSYDAAPLAPQDRAETVPLSGRVTGGVYQLDFQLGHWVEQRSFSGGSITGDGAAAIKP